MKNAKTEKSKFEKTTEIPVEQTSPSKQINDVWLTPLKEIFPTYSIIITKLSDKHLQLKMSSSKNDFSSVITDEVSKKLEDLFNTEDISMVGYRNKNSALTNLRQKRQSFKDHMCTIDVKNFKVEKSEENESEETE